MKLGASLNNDCFVERYKFFQENYDFVQKLPEREIFLIDCFLKFMGQRETAKIIGLTQGAISSRLNRAQTRLEYMKELNQFDFSEMEQKLLSFFESDSKLEKGWKTTPEERKFNIELIKGMWETTSQTETAKRLNSIYACTTSSSRYGQNHQTCMNQVKVRYRYEKILERLRKSQDSQYRMCLDFLTLIKRNQYKLVEIRLPHFERYRFSTSWIH